MNGLVDEEDHSTKLLGSLSVRWNVDHAINGSFSPDGKQRF